MIYETYVENDNINSRNVNNSGGLDTDHLRSSPPADPTDPIKKKKKKTRHFEHHIRKILKEISSDRDITQIAKTQLNDLAVITCKLIKQKVLVVLQSNKKRTITNVEIEAAIHLLFTGQLEQRLIEEGKKCVQQYIDNTKTKELKGQSRNTKAEILIPPSILERMLRSDSFQMFQMGFSAPIFLAGVIEYFIAQVLQLSVLTSKTVRITVQDLEHGIKSDREIKRYMIDQNIYLFEAGIVPFIHPGIRQLTGRNDKKSVKLMAKLQESNSSIFPKRFFEKLCKHFVMLLYPDIRFQKGCFVYLQDYIEKWIVGILQHTNILTLYSKKSRVTATDIEMVVSIMERRSPSFLHQDQLISDMEVLVLN
uniref:Core Histone H2A/H2B/H3 domain-containing protein n=1 Tax=viral metagenome TaxID=1070528 RepID=A0A6C0KE55_9ZZZZ